MYKLIVRSFIIVFWLAIIAGVLYFPALSKIDQKTINIFTWGDLLEPAVIKEFEEKTGIKIHLNYYTSNEELMVKMKATKGKGYDLIIPSDYAVNILSKENLLKPIDKSKLTFWHTIQPYLLDLPYDPNNTYSIPFMWEIFVLGLDKNYFKDVNYEPSWKMIFDRSTIDYKISMINDPIEGVQFASYYLYGNVDHLTPSQLQEVKALLIEQSSWVTAYSDSRGDYFLVTKNCPVIISESNYVQKAMQMFDYIEMAVPKEGSFVSIENLCIPSDSKKEEIIYKLINFMYERESMIKQIKGHTLLPVVNPDLVDLDLNEPTKKLLKSGQSEFKKNHFFFPLASEQEIRDIWLEVKFRGD